MSLNPYIRLFESFQQEVDKLPLEQQQLVHAATGARRRRLAAASHKQVGDGSFVDRLSKGCCATRCPRAER